MQMESKSTKKLQVVVIWLSRVLFKPETVDCTIFKIELGETASLHPISKSLRGAANTVKFVNL